MGLIKTVKNTATLAALTAASIVAAVGGVVIRSPERAQRTVGVLLQGALDVGARLRRTAAELGQVWGDRPSAGANPVMASVPESKARAAHAPGRSNGAGKTAAAPTPRRRGPALPASASSAAVRQTSAKPASSQRSARSRRAARKKAGRNDNDRE